MKGVGLRNNRLEQWMMPINIRISRIGDYEIEPDPDGCISDNYEIVFVRGFEGHHEKNPPRIRAFFDRSLIRKFVENSELKSYRILRRRAPVEVAFNYEHLEVIVPNTTFVFFFFFYGERLYVSYFDQAQTAPKKRVEQIEGHKFVINSDESVARAVSIIRNGGILNDDSQQAKTCTSLQENNEMLALNTIFYGPPGTGKTYGLTEAVKNITGIENDVNGFNNLKAIDEVKSGQIEFITFHQSYASEDFI